MSTTHIDSMRRTLYSPVRTTEDVEKLKHALEKCERQVLLSWTDDKGYDILHHAIMADNLDAVSMLFAHGHFKPPHEPKSHSYIQLAANYGNRSIAVMLIQERPRDYSIKKTKFKWVKKPTETQLVTKDGFSLASPLDIAGDCGHVGCIRSILDVSSVRNKLEMDSDKNNHLSAACASNSPSAVRLLLKQNPPQDDLKAAVGTALKIANAECLDVLLRCNPNLTTLFSGMNLYHVLFSYSLSFKKTWYESLLTVTSVLLKHNQSPVATVPFRTYPLYSLLSHTPASDFGKTSPYIIACAVILLNAGVDPNFDEFEFESLHSDLNIQTAFGRSAFPSSLHCLYGNIPYFLRHFEDDSTNVRRYVTKATETLLKHGADPLIFGPIEDSTLVGTALHAFLKFCIRLGIDERSITTFRLLTQNGGDPNINSDGIYPVNTFIEEILVSSDVFDAYYKHNETTICEFSTEIMRTLLNNMTPKAISKACSVDFGGKPTNQIQKKVFRICREELNKRQGSLMSLKQLCRLTILIACRMKCTRVVELPLPLPLKKYVNGIEQAY